MSNARDNAFRHPATSVRVVALDAGELLRALLGLDPSRGVHILDSGGARGDADAARYLIAGFDPFATVEAYGSELRIHTRDDASSRVEHRPALALLDEWLARYRLPPAATATAHSHLPATAACFATFSYDLARHFERLRAAPAAEPAAAESAPPNQTRRSPFATRSSSTTTRAAKLL